MRTIAIANQKGGSAKTTTAVNVAAALTELRQRVCLIDLDPQGSASSWLGVPLDGGRGLLDVVTGENNVHVADLAHDTAIAGLSVVPASPWLSAAEKTSAGEVGAETLLRAAFTRLPRERWDWLIVDCPPTLGFLTVSALVACRELLVPVEAHVMALAGLAALLGSVERIRERLNPALTVSAIVACRVDGRTRLAHDVVARLRERFGPLVLQTVIRESVRLAEAPSYQQPITVYAPESAGSEDYRAAARELVKREKRSARP
jgi:chromosome partitioning protein